MANDKLGRPSKERNALLRNQVTNLLWNGKIETTLAKAKSVASEAEKIITLAIKTYKDTVTVKKDIKDEKGVKIATSVVNDGPKKLDARRKIMAKLFDRQEVRQPKEAKSSFVERTKDIYHPLIEKIFNVYAPMYAKRAQETGTKGGYTTIVRLGARKGDNAQLAIVKMI